ncbi:MAG TPA: hypothetical protein VHM20_06605, partial [Gammaproteobacteria bacterium]|nr:hypothetical protein [Gammaproteobacteria bacterium]
MITRDPYSKAELINFTNRMDAIVDGPFSAEFNANNEQERVLSSSPKGTKLISAKKSIRTKLNSKETRDTDSKVLNSAFETYISAFSSYLNGPQDIHRKIIHLIVTITTENQSEQMELLEPLIAELSQDVNNQKFLLNAAFVLAKIVSSKKSQNPKEVSRDIVNSHERKSPDSDELDQSPLALNIKSLDTSDHNKGASDLGDLVPEDLKLEEESPIRPKIKEAKTFTKEFILSPLLNKICGKALNNNTYKMLESMINYYQNHYDEFVKNENCKVFEDVISELFNLCITPEILRKIVSKKEFISIEDKDALHLGKALLALSHSPDLFKKQTAKLTGDCDNYVAQLIKDNSGHLPDWVSSSMQVEDDKNPGALERSQKITKLIMLPLLKELYDLPEEALLTPNDKLLDDPQFRKRLEG